MNANRRQLCQTLVERNFLRWDADAKLSKDNSETENSYVKVDDVAGLTIQNGEELVWYSRLVRDVCEEWFHTG